MATITATATKPLHIDMPVELAEVNAAFSIGALAFEGISRLRSSTYKLITNDVRPR